MALLNGAWGERSGKLMTRRFDCASLCEKAPWTAKKPAIASSAPRISTRRFMKILLKNQNPAVLMGREFSLPGQPTASAESGYQDCVRLLVGPAGRRPRLDGHAAHLLPVRFRALGIR